MEMEKAEQGGTLFPATQRPQLPLSKFLPGSAGSDMSQEEPWSGCQPFAAGPAGTSAPRGPGTGTAGMGTIGIGTAGMGTTGMGTASTCTTGTGTTSVMPS